MLSARSSLAKVLPTPSHENQPPKIPQYFFPKTFFFTMTSATVASTSSQGNAPVKILKDELIKDKPVKAFRRPENAGESPEDPFPHPECVFDHGDNPSLAPSAVNISISTPESSENVTINADMEMTSRVISPSLTDSLPTTPNSPPSQTPSFTTSLTVAATAAEIFIDATLPTPIFNHDLSPTNRSPTTPMVAAEHEGLQSRSGGHLTNFNAEDHHNGAPRPLSTLSSADSLASSSSSPGRCRICYESHPGLHFPCRCQGSNGGVHPPCLLRWAMASDRTHCEVCQQPFPVRIQKEVRRQRRLTHRLDGARETALRRHLQRPREAERTDGGGGRRCDAFTRTLGMCVLLFLVCLVLIGIAAVALKNRGLLTPDEVTDVLMGGVAIIIVLLCGVIATWTSFCEQQNDIRVYYTPESNVYFDTV